MHADPRKLEECAEVCHHCKDACLRTIVHCLDLGGKHASRQHQMLLSDCIAICGVSHDFLRRESPLHAHTCRACAQVCNACADDCEQMAQGDRVMTECVRRCRECAQSCEQMASAG